MAFGDNDDMEMPGDGEMKLSGKKKKVSATEKPSKAKAKKSGKKSYKKVSGK